MNVTKTVQGGVVNLTNVKRNLLNREYENLQKYLHGSEDVTLHSANKQQADRYYEKIKEEKEYPLSIRKDLIDVQSCTSEVCDYFVNVPVAGRWGGVNLPVNTHTTVKPEWEICESKLFKQGDRFYLNITVEIAVPPVFAYHGVLGIDLGLRNPVVSVALPSRETRFLGQQIKRIQARYGYLRRNSCTGKKWSEREHNKVRDLLHKVTTKIADYARKHKLVVAGGDLKGVQNRDRGRWVNRKLHRFPHYMFRKMLAYKCRERGLEYVEVSEAYTSQVCSRCGTMGKRNNGLFKCPHCALELDADVNGARNISRRARGKSEIRPLVRVGAVVTQPELRSNDSTAGAFWRHVGERWRTSLAFAGSPPL